MHCDKFVDAVQFLGQTVVTDSILVVGSIPHRVAYRSGRVQNSDLVQYAFDLLSVLSTILKNFCVVLFFCVVQTALQFCGSQIAA